MLKEQIVSLLHSFSYVYWQRLQLRISTRISEPMRQAFESKKKKKPWDFYPDDNAWLHVGSALFKRKHSPPLWREEDTQYATSLPLQSCKTKP